jgi:hypothetical protein
MGTGCQVQQIHSGSAGKGRPVSDSVALLCASRALTYILHTWLNMYWEDFYEPSEFPCLKLMVVYLNLHMPGSEEMHLAQHLLFQWEFLEPSETAYEGEEPGFACWAHEEWSVQGPTVWTFHFMRWARRNEEPVTPQHLDHSLGCVLLCSQGSGFSGNLGLF